MIASGIRAIITCVDTEQLDAEFLGREFDKKLLKDLPPSVDPCGERGEFHTFCYASPAFRAALTVSRGERVVRGQFHFLDLRALHA
jgi:diphthamide synthase (EF-2-diphthine--ammonia ligase)